MDVRRKSVVLYDGHCVLCNRIIRWLLQQDLDYAFIFLPIQSEKGQLIIEKNTKNKNSVSPQELILLYENKFLFGGEAVVRIMTLMHGSFRFMGRVLHCLPSSWINCLYRVIAKNRYWILGKQNSCFNPSAMDY
ncbi:DUF393 domain-containing protein [Marinilabiliaceae bacterium JC017]|nr:DUF393 domain-containing protein [Marinilabiliaceae bacterium JC017]